MISVALLDIDCLLELNNILYVYWGQYTTYAELVEYVNFLKISRSTAKSLGVALEDDVMAWLTPAALHWLSNKLKL